ncbi:transglycosylase SLT domain-containing protein, partial [bacterium]|nr:transglycosylase SLT domain-containing protein [bacterium]
EVYRRTSRKKLAQEALYWKCLKSHNPGEPKYDECFERLVEKYPSDTRTDDALFWLARGAQLEGELDQSVARYRRLLAYEGESQYVARAGFFPALGLICRGQPRDLELAKDILNELLVTSPDCLLRPHATFWIGRIAEEQGDTALASRMFRRCVNEQPYSYYGIRARMHLADGRDARSQILIEDEGIREELRSAFAGGTHAARKQDGAGSVYSRRIRASLRSGLYAAALGGEEELRSVRASTRVQDCTFEELDELGLLTRIAVMIALQQEALAAADANRSVADRKTISGLVADSADDWPLVMSLVHQKAVGTASTRSELMNLPGYLTAAYPRPYESLIQEAAGEYQVSPAILYATMRNESYFCRAALSESEALGLFQFSPRTFNGLDREWRLVETAGSQDRRAFLLDERHSIDLAARWFSEKLLPLFGQNPLLAVLAHHSGEDRVGTWMGIWEERGLLGDVELMIESFRKKEYDGESADKHGFEAREFGRLVLTDMAIAEAMGLYQNAMSGSGGR